MNGIDVSAWNRGIDISKVSCDFVIVKATQGTAYTNPDCDRVVQQCINLGKCWGVYHYINGNPAEIDFFVNSIRGYIGKGLICLDWEGIQNKQWGNLEYLEDCIKRVIELTGIKPIVYASKSVFPFALCKKYDCGTWVAQYANNNVTGYQARPWNNGAYAIYQYTSHGKLEGWHGLLDLDKANMNREQWAAYANPRQTAPREKGPDVQALAEGVIRGNYGNGAERRKALGGNYDKVQRQVNEIFELARRTKRGEFGNGTTRKNALGGNYDIVQYVINNKLV